MSPNVSSCTYCGVVLSSANKKRTHEHAECSHSPKVRALVNFFAERECSECGDILENQSHEHEHKVERHPHMPNIPCKQPFCYFQGTAYDWHDCSSGPAGVCYTCDRAGTFVQLVRCQQTHWNLELSDILRKWRTFFDWYVRVHAEPHTTTRCGLCLYRGTHYAHARNCTPEALEKSRRLGNKSTREHCAHHGRPFPLGKSPKFAWEDTLNPTFVTPKHSSEEATITVRIPTEVLKQLQSKTMQDASKVHEIGVAKPPSKDLPATSRLPAGDLSSPGMVVPAPVTAETGRPIYLNRTGPPPSSIVMTGERRTFTDIVYGVPRIVSSGVIDTTKQSGSLIIEIPYGSYLSTEVKDWANMHRSFAGSFEYTFQVFSNAALSGAVIAGWVPAKKNDYNISDLQIYDHLIMNFSDRTTMTFGLEDLRRSDFWRDSREFFEPGNNMDNLPRLVIMVYSPLASFTGDQGPSVNWKLLSKPGVDFSVNGYLGLPGSNDPNDPDVPGYDNVVPSDLMPGAYLVADGPKVFHPSSSYYYYNHPLNPILERTSNYLSDSDTTIFLVLNRSTDAQIGIMVVAGAFRYALEFGGLFLRHFERGVVQRMDAEYLEWYFSNPADCNTLFVRDANMTFSFKDTSDVEHVAKGMAIESLNTNAEAGGIYFVATNQSVDTSTLKADTLPTIIDAFFTPPAERRLDLEGPELQRLVMSQEPSRTPKYAATEGPVTPDGARNALIAENLAALSFRLGVEGQYILFDIHRASSVIGSICLVTGENLLIVKSSAQYAYLSGEGVYLDNPRAIPDLQSIPPLDVSYWSVKSPINVRLARSSLATLQSGLGAFFGGSLSGVGSGLSQWASQAFWANQNNLKWDHEMEILREGYAQRQDLMKEQFDMNMVNNSLVAHGKVAARDLGNDKEYSDFAETDDPKALASGRTAIEDVAENDGGDDVFSPYGTGDPRDATWAQASNPQKSGSEGPIYESVGPSSLDRGQDELPPMIDLSTHPTATREQKIQHEFAMQQDVANGKRAPHVFKVNM